MALPSNHPVTEHMIAVYMTDTSSVQAGYGTSHWKGRVIKAYSVLQGQAIGTANNVLTLSINGTAITGGTITQLTSGSAAGDVATCIPSSANVVAEGDTLTCTSDGGGSNTCPSMIYFVVKSE